MSCPIRRSLASFALVALVLGGVGGWFGGGTPRASTGDAPTVATAITTAFPTAEAGFAARRSQDD